MEGKIRSCEKSFTVFQVKYMQMLESLKLPYSCLRKIYDNIGSNNVRYSGSFEEDKEVVLYLLNSKR